MAYNFPKMEVKQLQLSELPIYNAIVWGVSL